MSAPSAIPHPESAQQPLAKESESNLAVDKAVISLFPSGTILLSAGSSGSSEWSQTGFVIIQLPDGSSKKCFLKLALRDHGSHMLHGEFAALTTIDSFAPGLVPKPLGWGKYGVSSPETYFLLEDFRDLNLDLPNPKELAQRAVELHSHTSPNGLFGFEISTFNGNVKHVTDWEPSWAKFFARFLRNTISKDEEKNGRWPEFTTAAVQVLTAVVPRLLDVLQFGPNPIVPSLVHGDLWSGNIGTDRESGEIVFFDPGSYFAHNEMELGMWRRDATRYLGASYLREYQQLVGPAEPKVEFDDRNRLYCLHYRINYSIGHPGALERETALNDMLYLCEKYAPLDGLPKYNPQKERSALV